MQTREVVSPASSTLKLGRHSDLFFGRCCGSIASAWETLTGKARAPQCKYCFWFTQKTVADTENTAVIHSFPRQTWTSYLRNSRFLGLSIKITLELEVEVKQPKLRNYRPQVCPLALFFLSLWETNLYNEWKQGPMWKPAHDQTTKNRDVRCTKQRKCGCMWTESLVFISNCLLAL